MGEGSLWVPPKEVVVFACAWEGQVEEGPSWALEDQAPGGACGEVGAQDGGGGAEEEGHQGP